MSNVPDNGEAFVTTLITDDYLPGVLILNRSILDTCSHSLFVLAARGLAEETYEALRGSGIPFCVADSIPANSDLFAESDPAYSHWTKTLFKLRIFELTQFRKIVFIDCDIMVLVSIDDLFDCPDMSAAVAGGSFPGNESWRDLSSGVMVIEPRAGIVEELIAAAPAVAAEKQTFGDQDVFIKYFSDWPLDERLHLPESYNVFFDHYRFYLKHGGVKVLHFIGRVKPWMLTRAAFLVQLVRCVVKNNSRGIRMLLRYRRYQRDV